MIQLYNTLFYQPIFNLLIWLYNIVPGNDIGIAIILLTIIIRVVLFPLYYQSIRSQRSLQEIQPKVDEVRNRLKDNKEQLSKELMELYKTEKVNPFSSCLPLLIQFPFLIAVYQVFRHGLNSESFELLYSFVTNPGHINPISLGFIDLGVPSIVLAFLAGAAQFWQAQMMMLRKPPLIKGKEIKGSKDEKMMATMNKQMVYFMPFITVIIGISLPAGLTLYWFVTTLLMALQQLWMFKKKKKVVDEVKELEDKEEKKIIDIEPDNSTQPEENNNSIKDNKNS